MKKFAQRAVTIIEDMQGNLHVPVVDEIAVLQEVVLARPNNRTARRSGHTDQSVLCDNLEVSARSQFSV